jgi:RHS repeat-associated protein
MTITNAYNGLGAVVASHTQSNSSVYWNLEEFRATQIGNVWYSRSRKAAAADSESTTSFFTADGLLYARKASFPANCAPGTVHLDTLYQIADAAGNVIRTGERRQSGCDNNANNRQTVSNSYYSAHNKLMAIQKWTDPGAFRTWEEYWYDALGRRVFTRTRHDQPTCGAPVVCPGFVDRTVWDGDQIIAEQRSSSLDDVTGGAPNFGTVRYVHLLGIDAPVAILDNRFSDARVIHYNWRGLAEASSWSNGNPADEELGGGVKLAWPAGQGVYLKKGNNPNVGQDVTWIGSLPANGQGDAGLVYRRNRYYDPASGRFTQEDPIGLAGGLNLYGFANADPINFSDAFGLCASDAGDGSDDTGTDSTSTEDPDQQKQPDCRLGTMTKTTEERRGESDIVRRDMYAWDVDTGKPLATGSVVITTTTDGVTLVSSSLIDLKTGLRTRSVQRDGRVTKGPDIDRVSESLLEGLTATTAEARDKCNAVLNSKHPKT